MASTRIGRVSYRLWGIVPLLAVLMSGCSGKVSAGEEAVKALLTDPNSAEFRNIHTYPNDAQSRLCGEVNAKNLMGGYVGFKRFVVDLRSNHAEIDPGQPELSMTSAAAVDAWAAGKDFDRRFDTLCSDVSDSFADRLLAPPRNASR